MSGTVSLFPTSFMAVQVHHNDSHTTRTIKMLQEQANETELLARQAYATYISLTMQLENTLDCIDEIQGTIPTEVM